MCVCVETSGGLLPIMKGHILYCTELEPNTHVLPDQKKSAM